MKKKFLALVMTLSMVLSLVPMTALAAGDGEPIGQPTTTAENQAAGADANEGKQESGSNTGANNASSGHSTDTNTGENKDQNGESASTGGTTPDGSSTPDTGTSTEGGDTGTGGGTEPTEPEKPEVPKYAAKIGDTEYETIAAAINAIQEGSSDNTITLLCDVKENIKINKSLTLDLGGYTLTGDGKKTVVSISGKDIDVTVKDGTVTGGYAINGGGFDIQSGNIKIENCIIEKNTATSGGGGVNIGGSANVKITGSEISNNTVAHSSGGAIYLASGSAYGGYYNCVCEVVDTKLNGNSAVIGGAVGMGASLFHDGINNAYGGKGVTAT